MKVYGGYQQIDILSVLNNKPYPDMEK